VLGVIDDVANVTRSGWTEPGLSVFQLGTTRSELDGSAWADVVHGQLGGRPPQVDLAAERALAEVLVRASRDRLLDAAHDLSEGGLAQALVEASLRYGVGASIDLAALCERDGVTLFEALFSESAARAVVAVPRSQEVRLQDLCTGLGVPLVRFGTTDDLCRPGEGVPLEEDHVHEPCLEVKDAFTIPLAELREAWTGTLPRLFG